MILSQDKHHANTALVLDVFTAPKQARVGLLCIGTLPEQTGSCSRVGTPFVLRPRSAVQPDWCVL